MPTEQAGIGKHIKRRGILAAAGAVVAGIAATQISQPVAAATGGTQGTQLIIGANSESGTANIGTEPTMLFNGVSTIGSYYVADTFVAASRLGSAVQGYAYANGAGVAGYNVGGTQNNASGVYGSAGSGIGAYGLSTTGVGVQGDGGQDGTFNTTGFPIGVRGSVKDTGYGLYGKAGNGFAIYGTVAGGIGVNGIAMSNIGVRGEIPGNSTAANTVAVQASNQATGAGGKALYALMSGGTATGTIGIYAANVTSAPNSHGIVGLAQSGHGLVGTCTAHSSGGNVYAGLVGFAGVSDANAGNFYGNVAVTGNLYVGGSQTVAGAKSAALAHPDGSHRLVYCVEAPESWLEDFGEGRLSGGKAEVKLDADFTAVADMGQVHVFLTPGADSKGLYVINKSASGFSVREQQGGASTLTFSWRVVAKRKDVKAGRLAKVDLPKLTPPTALSQVPDLPPPPPMRKP